MTDGGWQMILSVVVSFFAFFFVSSLSNCFLNCSYCETYHSQCMCSFLHICLILDNICNIMQGLGIRQNEQGENREMVNSNHLPLLLHLLLPMLRMNCLHMLIQLCISFKPLWILLWTQSWIMYLTKYVLSYFMNDFLLYILCVSIFVDSTHITFTLQRNWRRKEQVRMRRVLKHHLLLFILFLSLLWCVFPLWLWFLLFNDIFTLEGT